MCNNKSISHILTYSKINDDTLKKEQIFWVSFDGWYCIWNENGEIVFIAKQQRKEIHGR